VNEFRTRIRQIRISPAGSAKPRDFVDAIHLHETYLSLGTLARAAAGKDEGFNPRLALNLADRFARYRQADIDSLHLSHPLSLPDLKERWPLRSRREEGLWKTCRRRKSVAFTSILRRLSP
jgi:hypothetical protein